jgi:hypothetical protein
VTPPRRYRRYRHGLSAPGPGMTESQVTSPGVRVTSLFNFSRSHPGGSVRRTRASLSHCQLLRHRRWHTASDWRLDCHGARHRYRPARRGVAMMSYARLILTPVSESESGGRRESTSQRYGQS